MANQKFRQCSLCGERFVTVGVLTGSEHSCAQMAAAIADHQRQEREKYEQRLRIGSATFTAEELATAIPDILAARAVNTLAFFAPGRDLKFKPKAKADKCGPRCWGAKKEDCSCECEGAHHGIGRSPANAKDEEFFKEAA